MILFTSPDVKPYIVTTDLDRFTIGDYVQVLEDYTTGYNRPSGCGYVSRVTNDVVDVKFTPAHDGGRLHKDIPLTKAIPAILHQDMMIHTERRARETKKQSSKEIEITVDTRTTTEKLLHLLTNNNRRQAGWHRRDLRLNPKLDNSATAQLNKTEKTQLYTEAEIL